MPYAASGRRLSGSVSASVGRTEEVYVSAGAPQRAGVPCEDLPMTDAVPEWYRPVLAVSDAEIAFDLGRYHLAQRTIVDEAFAHAWFVQAGHLGTVDMPWRIVVEQAEKGRWVRARWWMRAALATEYRAGSGPISVEQRTMEIRVDKRGVVLGQDFRLQVVSPTPGVAAVALAAAAERFYLVTADGREFRTGGEMHAVLAEEGAGDPDTVNYVSEVQRHADGPWLWMDFKDGVSPQMARTMIRILVEELGRAGVSEALVRSVEE
jgi:hypothetical protein